jgi:hypothetical protein
MYFFNFRFKVISYADLGFETCWWGNETLLKMLHYYEMASHGGRR